MNGDETLLSYIILIPMRYPHTSNVFLTAIIDALVVPAADLQFKDVMFYKVLRRFHDH